MIITSPQSWKRWAQQFPQRAAADAPAYKSPFRVVNKTAAAAEILIYDQIGRDFWSGEGMAANDFAELLADIDPAAELTIGINSPGGNVWDGLAIYNMLAARKGRVITRNDGMAASIASVILQAGHERQTNTAALVMIHRAWGLMVGNAEDAETFKKELEKHDQIIAEIYAARGSHGKDQYLAAMSDETFYTGSEAKQAGLVDAVLPAVGDQKKNLTAASVAAAKPGSIQSAAGKPTNHNTPMETQAPTAPAANQPPAQTLDSKIIVDAINALRDDLKNSKAPALGADPVGHISRVENLGNPLVEKFEAFAKNDHINRANFVREYHRDIRAQLLKHKHGGSHEIKALNTVDSALVNSLISADFLTTMRTKMAPLAAFSHQVSASPMSARQVINVNLLSSAGSTQDNPTNFETGDTTSTAKPITLAHVNRSFYVSNSEQDLGLGLAQKAPTNARIMAEGIMAKVVALMTNGNFGADINIGAAADFSSTDLPAILALGANYDRTTLLLSKSYLAYLLPTSRESFAFGEAGAYGFDGGIYGNNYWSGGASDLVGFVCGPDAIIWGAAPVADGPNGSGLQVSDITLPEIGLTVKAHTWFALSSRALWASYDVCFGAAVGDATQAEVLTSQ